MMTYDADHLDSQNTVQPPAGVASFPGSVAQSPHSTVRHVLPNAGGHDWGRQDDPDFLRKVLPERFGEIPNLDADEDELAAILGLLEKRTYIRWLRRPGGIKC
jgi:hypothetical protein